MARIKTTVAVSRTLGVPSRTGGAIPNVIAALWDFVRLKHHVGFLFAQAAMQLFRLLKHDDNLPTNVIVFLVLFLHATHEDTATGALKRNCGTVSVPVCSALELALQLHGKETSDVLDTDDIDELRMSFCEACEYMSESGYVYPSDILFQRFWCLTLRLLNHDEDRLWLSERFPFGFTSFHQALVNLEVCSKLFLDFDPATDPSDDNQRMDHMCRALSNHNIGIEDIAIIIDFIKDRRVHLGPFVLTLEMYERFAGVESAMIDSDTMNSDGESVATVEEDNMDPISDSEGD